MWRKRNLRNDGINRAITPFQGLIMASRVDQTAKYMPLPVNIKRENPVPLDKESVWQDETSMRNYAKDGATSYVGQILSLADGAVTKAFIILDEAGNLLEFGSGGGGGEVTELSGYAAATDQRIVGMVTSLSSNAAARDTAIAGSVTSLSSSALSRDNAIAGSITSLSSQALSRDNALAGSITSLSSNASSTDRALSAWIGEVSAVVSSFMSGGAVGALSGCAEQTDKRLGGQISTLSGNVTSVAGSITSLSAAISSISSSMAGIQQTIASLSALYLRAFFEPET